MAVRAAQVGLEVGWKTYKAQDMTTQGVGWNIYTARHDRYGLAQALYENTVYDSVHGAATQYKEARKLYQFIEGLHNPVNRLVEMYVARVYPGLIDWHEPNHGAIPLHTENDGLIEKIHILWRASQMATKKNLFVRHGARFGDMVINIIDDVTREEARLEFLHPGKVKDAKHDPHGALREITFEYIRIDEDTQEQYIFTELVTLNSYQTFKNGKPFAFREDVNGNPVDQWDNPYGFIPTVLGQHTDIGEDWGMSPFHETIPKIDSANMTASLLADALLKGVDTIWALSGVDKEDDLEMSVSDKDQTRILYLPEGAKVTPMAPDIDVMGFIARLDSQMNEIEKSLPELALAKMRDNIRDVESKPALMASLPDVIGRFDTATSQYDQTFVMANRMGLSIGGFRGYQGYDDLDLDDWREETTSHHILERPLFQDVLSLEKKLNIMVSVDTPRAAVLAELGFNQEQIDNIEEMAEENRKKAQQDMMETAVLMGENDDSDESQNAPTAQAAPVAE